MQGEEMVSPSVRTIRQYCSVCKATLEMSVVETVQDEVTWLKCPRCNGILPHMLSTEEEVEAAPEKPLEAAAEPETGFTQEERAEARDYDPALSFEAGEIVYHRSINRHGRVIEKTVLPGRRAAIRVQFEDGEEMTLREQA